MLLPVLACMAAGALLVLATQRGLPPQFVTVQCPPGVVAGQPFQVQLPENGSLLERLGRRRAARLLTVVAPPGISEGQTFFVPLLARPVATAKDAGAAGGKGAVGAAAAGETNTIGRGTAGKAKAS